VKCPWCGPKDEVGIGIDHVIQAHPRLAEIMVGDWLGDFVKQSELIK